MGMPDRPRLGDLPLHLRGLVPELPQPHLHPGRGIPDLPQSPLDPGNQMIHPHDLGGVHVRPTPAPRTAGLQ
ncbi:hypothetical protein Acsp01_29300 [Actinoplanes sp. NBRC 101535]|nr:hypothetical protein Acsp01_29300 [Actinoplanes sp. NBRC 101535]